MLEEHYNEKANWLKLNTPLAAIYFKNTCQKCNKHTHEKNGAIHHLKYTGHDYKKTFEKVIADEAITWICKTCHKKEHVAITPEEVTYNLKHSGFCALCDKFAWQAWFKVSMGTKHYVGNDNFPLCNKCLKNLVNLNILKEYVDQLGYKYVFWSDNKTELSQIAVETNKLLLSRIEKGSFGSLDWLDDQQNQLEMELPD